MDECLYLKGSETAYTKLYHLAPNPSRASKSMFYAKIRPGIWVPGSSALGTQKIRFILKLAHNYVLIFHWLNHSYHPFPPI